MKKSLICILLIACMLTALVGCGCDHTFEEKWSTDGTHHWHVCTQEDCGEQSEKGEHDWDEGTVTLQPTASTPGVRRYTCKVCSAIKTESVNGEPTVSDLEWAEAFLLLDENFRMTVVKNSQDNLIVKKRNGIVVVSDPQTVRLTESYFVKEGTTYYCYDRVADTVTRREVTEQEYLANTTLISLQGLAYADFTYDEAAKKYKVAQTTLDQTVFEDVLVSFLNGRLEMITFTRKAAGAANEATVITVTYGTVANDIVLPQVTA